jgi:hypothetical protein
MLKFSDTPILVARIYCYANVQVHGKAQKGIRSYRCPYLRSRNVVLGAGQSHKTLVPFSGVFPRVLVAVVMRKSVDSGVSVPSGLTAAASSRSGRAIFLTSISLRPRGIGSCRLAVNHKHFHDHRLPTEPQRTWYHVPQLGGAIRQIRIRPRDRMDSECCHW